MYEQTEVSMRMNWHGTNVIGYAFIDRRGAVYTDTAKLTVKVYALFIDVCQLQLL